MIKFRPAGGVLLAGLLTALLAPTALAFSPTQTGQIGPQFPQQLYHQSYYYQLELGSQYAESQDFEHASQAFDNAVETNPTMVLGQYNLGYTLMKQAENEPVESKRTALLNRAEWAFLRARDISPEVGVTYFKLGRIALLKEDFDLASQYYQMGTEIYPQNPALWFNLGAAEEKLKHTQKAEEAYIKALAADPTFVFAYNNLGLLYEEANQPEKAEAMYRQALAIEPSYNFARLNLGTMLQALGRLDEAEVLYREAVKLEPQNPWAHLYLGNACFRKNHYQEALVAYQRVARLNPQYPTTYYLMSLVLHKLNRSNEALESGLQYIQMEPHGTFAKEATEMILTIQHAKPSD